jgi:hypothetical protein
MKFVSKTILAVITVAIAIGVFMDYVPWRKEYIRPIAFAVVTERGEPVSGVLVYYVLVLGRHPSFLGFPIPWPSKYRYVYEKEYTDDNGLIHFDRRSLRMLLWEEAIKETVYFNLDIQQHDNITNDCITAEEFVQSADIVNVMPDLRGARFNSYKHKPAAIGERSEGLYDLIDLGLSLAKPSDDIRVVLRSVNTN